MESCHYLGEQISTCFKLLAKDWSGNLATITNLQQLLT